jgi:hypothetical protein
VESKKTKQKAQFLRSQGLTYTEITQRLGVHVSKGTLSYWLKNVEMAPEHRERIKKESLQRLSVARKKALATNKKKFETFLAKIEKRTRDFENELDSRNSKIALAMLYMGEGSKWKSHRGMSLGSSNPEIVKLYVNLLRICYDISPEKLNCRLQHRADQDPKNLQAYWSKLTGVPVKRFYPPYSDKRTVGKKTKNPDYKGVCVVSGGSTKYQLELEKIAEAISRAVSSVG